MQAELREGAEIAQHTPENTRRTASSFFLNQNPIEKENTHTRIAIRTFRKKVEEAHNTDRRLAKQRIHSLSLIEKKKKNSKSPEGCAHLQAELQGGEVQKAQRAREERERALIRCVRRAQVQGRPAHRAREFGGHHVVALLYPAL